MMNRTRRLLSVVSLVALFTILMFNHSFSAEPAATPTPLPPSSSPIGTNLSEVVDWTTELPFIDLFKTARQWVPQCTSADPGCDTTKWSTGEEPQLDLDPNGWVKSLPRREDAPVYTFVSTVFLVGDTRLNYGGQYLVLYEGQGRIEYDNGATKDSASRPGRDVINVSTNGFARLMIKETNPSNHIRNIRVIRPEYETTYNLQIFDSNFLDRLEDFSTLRFMDWMRTNNSTQQLWDYRPTTELATYTTVKGVPLEVMVLLANQIGKYPWFNMPHLADDNYVRQFAEMVRDNLNPNLIVYVEHSNEVWNSAFAQYNYAAQRGQAEFSSGTTFDRILNWHGRRTAEICEIWKIAFDGQEQRLRCVAGAQAANSDASEKILSCPLWRESPCSGHGIDALAIAPYFGYYLGAPAYESQIDAWTKESDGGLTSLFTELERGGKLQATTARGAEDSADLWAISSASRYHLPLPPTSETSRSAENNLVNTPPADGALRESFRMMSNSKGVANRHRVLLIAYEGGQHLVGYQGVENNDAITSLFQNANRDSRMGDLYDSYFNEWKRQDGQLLTHFSLATNYTKWGSWGMLEYITQNGSPKYNAIIDFIKANHCWWDCLLPTVTPTPTTTGTPTSTSTPTSTTTPTTTPTPSQTPTGTILPTSTFTNTPTPTPSNTPPPGATYTPTPPPGATLKPSNTPPPGATYTPIPTPSPIPTSTRTPLPTLPPYFTPTPLPLPTIDESLIIYETITPIPIFINGTVSIYDAMSKSEIDQERGIWLATVTLQIVDELKQPIPNAVVQGRWLQGRMDTGRCISDLNGLCQVMLPNISSERERATFQVNVIVPPSTTAGQEFEPIFVNNKEYSVYQGYNPLSIALQNQVAGMGINETSIWGATAILGLLTLLFAQHKRQ